VRDEACRYAARRRCEGTAWSEIAREAGLDARKLQRWRFRAQRSAPVPVLRPVEVVPTPDVVPEGSPDLALVAPSGLRTEELQLEQAAQLFRLLA
jgi:hypothetical protein